MTTEEELDDYAYQLGNRLRDLVDRNEIRYWERLAEKGDPRAQAHYDRVRWDYQAARNLRARRRETE